MTVELALDLLKRDGVFLTEEGEKELMKVLAGFLGGDIQYDV